MYSPFHWDPKRLKKPAFFKLISGVLITKSPHPIIEIFLKKISKSWFQYSPGVERLKLSIV